MTSPDRAARYRGLQHLPITLFTTVMGLIGLSLALYQAAAMLRWSMVIPAVIYWFGVAVFAAVACGYLLKLLRYRQAVLAEWRDPEQIAYFPAISISILLVATATVTMSEPIGHGLWLVGVAAQAALTLSVISSWIGRREFQHPQLCPAWFIPAVGNVIVAFAGVPLGYLEISWLFFSLGLMFWVILLTLVVNRLIFHAPLPARLQPTLVILIAPPALGFSAYLGLTGQVDPMAHMLLDFGYAFALVVSTQGLKILRLPFSMSFWALSFPVAALTIASFKYADAAQSRAHVYIGLALLSVLVLTIIVLILRTVQAFVRGDIFKPEEDGSAA